MRKLSAVSVLVACVAIAGCGGDDDASTEPSAATNAKAGVETTAQAQPPAQQIEEVGRSYAGVRGEIADIVRESYAALAQGDGAAVCELQSDALKARFVKIERLSRPQYRGKGCAEIRTMLSELYTPEARRSFYKIKIKKVTVRGKRATVIHEVPDVDPTHTEKVDTSVPLRLQDGTWKLDG